MTGHARLRLTAGGMTLLPFVGVWLGHTAEYWRVRGADGLGAEALGSVHGYMVPAGLVLSLLVAVSGLHLLRAWWTLGRHLREARAAVAGAWRGHRTTCPVEPRRRPPRALSLVLRLAPVQVALYVLQENVEAWRAAQPAPGLGAITGAHWAAPLVHLAVAACMAAAVVLAQRGLARRVRAVRACQRLARVLCACRPRPAVPRPAGSRVAPCDRWQVQLLRRPPPVLLLAP